MQANVPNHPEANPPKSAPQTAPTTDASLASVPEYPRELYDEAGIENEHRDFNKRLLEARGPNGGKPAYVPPEVPAGVASQTALEMKAGADRVKHFAGVEQSRKEIVTRVPEKWEGKNTAVFRPPEITEYKNTFKSPAQTPSKDNLRQPQNR